MTQSSVAVRDFNPELGDASEVAVRGFAVYPALPAVGNSLASLWWGQGDLRWVNALLSQDFPVGFEASQVHRDVGRLPELPEGSYDLVVGLAQTELGEWMAVDNLTGEYGEGANCADAVRDLIMTLYEARDLLRDHPGELSSSLAQELDVLEARLLDGML